jgi:hypothetical protein
MNPFRNEAVVKLGAHEILLRATFENIAAMEDAVGAVSYLGYKYSEAHRLSQKNASLDKIVKASPPLSEIAKIIYFNQAATDPDDETKKKHSLEEIWEMVQEEGIACINPVVTYISILVAGKKSKQKLDSKEEKEEEALTEKKS